MRTRGPRADFVVVGPPGVFVIGCGRRHEKERAHAKELMRLLEVAHQVAEVAGVRRDEVHPVLCLTGDQPEDSWSRGVSVCGIVNLADTLVFKRDRLDPERSRAAALAVGRTMRSGGNTEAHSEPPALHRPVETARRPVVIRGRLVGMAITTDFIGHVGIEPALDSDQIERLAALVAAARTRVSHGSNAGGWRARTVAA